MPLKVIVLEKKDECFFELLFVLFFEKMLPSVTIQRLHISLLVFREGAVYNILIFADYYYGLKSFEAVL